MPKFSQMNKGSYLKKEDFPSPVLLTVMRYTEENVAREGEPAEMKWVVHFAELDRGMVLNPTNQNLMQAATGCEDSESTVGKKVVVFTDPNVSMGGKLVGGLRIRAPRNQAPIVLPKTPPIPDPASAQPGPETDDVPF